jgi:tetratricopeptide (TPR) repeat protein
MKQHPVSPMIPTTRDTMPRPRVRLPVIREDLATAPSPRRLGGSTSETDMRFRLVSVLRVADNFISSLVAAYDRVFSLEPAESADIYLQMATEFLEEGRFESARDALRQAARLRADDPDVHVELGIVHFKREAPDAAIFAFEKAEELGANSYRFHRYYAEALIRKKRPLEAIPKLEQARACNRDAPELLYRMGTLFDEIGRHREAVAAFEEAVALAPNEVAYHQSLGFALESVGERKAAIKCFKRALDLEHESAAAE